MKDRHESMANSIDQSFAPALNAFEELVIALENHQIAKGAYLKNESSNELNDVMNTCEDVIGKKLVAAQKILKEWKGEP